MHTSAPFLFFSDQLSVPSWELGDKIEGWTESVEGRRLKTNKEKQLRRGSLGREPHVFVSVPSPQMELESRLPTLPQLVVNKCLTSLGRTLLVNAPLPKPDLYPANTGQKRGPGDLDWTRYTQYVLYTEKKSTEFKQGVISSTADHY